MIGAIIAAAISAIASGVGTHLANKKKAQAQEKYEAGINKEVADLDAEINSNYLDRADLYSFTYERGSRQCFNVYPIGFNLSCRSPVGYLHIISPYCLSVYLLSYDRVQIGYLGV